MGDGSIQRTLHTIAPLQKRNYVVMEVKANLLKDERSRLLSKFAPSAFKRTAAVMMGDPPHEMKEFAQSVALKIKQDAADVEFRAQQAAAKKKREAEKLKKKQEKERKKAEKASKKK